jgi:hypothetical protein
MRAAIFAVAMALALGLWLGLLLTGTGPGASGLVGGEYWILVITYASVYLGWQLAQLDTTPLSLVAAPLFVVLMIAVMLGVKFIHLPWAALVSDSFPILILIAAAAGALGALIGRAPSLRARTPAAAARTGLCLAAAAFAVSVATYGLASVTGS